MSDKPRIPLTVVSGFLGSGKTTLLNHLLATTSGRRIAVLVNDFGPINIDAQLIAQHDGKTISLTNGCICCSIGSGLDAALIDVLALQPRPDWIVIEASGISDPGPIAAVALADPSLRLAGVVTLLDAEHIEAQLGDARLNDTLARQIRNADLLVLNKADLLDADALAQRHRFLQRHFPDTPVLEARQARLAESALLMDVEQPSARAPQQQHHHHATSDHPFVSTVWRSQGTLSADRLMQALRALPRHVVRAKGWVHTDYHGPAIVHFSGRRVQFQAVQALPATDNEMVFIGLPDSMDAQGLQRMMNACRL